MILGRTTKSIDGEFLATDIDKQLGDLENELKQIKEKTDSTDICPYFFEGLVRDNPVRFVKKYAHYTSLTRNQQHFKHGEDSTETKFVAFFKVLIKNC
jgi:hypothetical protein